MSKNNGYKHFAWPLVAAAYLCVYAALGDRLSINDGLGWDGIAYAHIAQSFWTMINGGIEAYTSGRILPSAIIYVTTSLLHLDMHNASTVVRSFQVYNGILFVGAAILWSLVSRAAGFTWATSAAGFLGLFVNYHAMVGIQFSSVQTDTSAFFLAMAVLYGWVARRPLIVFMATLAGAFVWPTATLAGMTLLIFPRDHQNVGRVLRCRPVYLGAAAVVAFCALLGYALYTGQQLCCGAPQPDSATVVPATVVAMAFVFYVARAMPPSIALPRLDRGLLGRLLLAALLVAAIGLLRSRIHILEVEQPYTREYLLGSALTAIAKPGAFFIAHATYLGPLFLLSVIWAPRLLQRAQMMGLGALSVICLFFAMSINSESRQLYFLWPFVVYFVSCLLGNKEELKLSSTAIIAVASLLASKFYLPLGFNETLSKVEDLAQFPWQWFVMNQGPWMGWPGYGSNLVLVLAEALFLFLGLRRALGVRDRFMATSQSMESSPAASAVSRQPPRSA